MTDEKTSQEQHDEGPDISSLEVNPYEELAMEANAVDEVTCDESTTSESVESRVVQFQDIFPDILSDEIKATIISTTSSGVVDNESVVKSLLNWNREPLDTLEEWRGRMKIEGLERIVVDRCSLSPAANAVIVYKAPTQSLRKSPHVTFVGEAGVDRGALWLEFSVQTLKVLTQETIQEGGPLFEGTYGHLVPVASKVHLINQMFLVFGKALAHSVLHGAAGVGGMSPAVQFVLCNNVKQEDIDMAGVPVTIDDLSDPDMGQVLKKTFEDLDTLDRHVILQAMESSGFGFTPIKVDTYRVIQQHIVSHLVLGRRWSELMQIRRGMEEFGLHTLLCNASSTNIQKSVFLSLEDEVISSDNIIDAINDLQLDEPLRAWFRKMLQDLENRQCGDASLKELVMFWTGDTRIIGTLEISVNEDKFPVAHTCFSNLEVPKGCDSYSEFLMNFKIAVKQCTGFGMM